MAGNADSNRVALRYIKEVTWGTTPATPTMQAMRFTGESLAYDKQTVISNEIRDDRMVPDIIKVGVNANGGFNMELSCSTFDDLYAAALGDDWGAAIALTALTLTVASSGKTFTKSGGTSFITSGIKVGQWIKFGGFTNPENNIYVQVTAVTADVITAANATGLKDEAGSGDETISGKMLRNSTDKVSFTIEKVFSDVANAFIQFTGMRVNTATLNLTAKQVATGSFEFIGKNVTTSDATVSTAITAATTTDVLSASAHVAAIMRDGVALADNVRSLTLNINNNLRAQDVVMSEFAAGVGDGRLEISGTLEAYVANLTMFKDMIAHTTLALSWRFMDAAGNALIFTLPAVKLAKGNPAAGGANQDVMIPLEFQAKRDATTNCMIQLDYIAAA